MATARKSSGQKSAAKKKARKLQPRAEITRAKILKASLREFAHFGLAGARVDVIAQRAGVNKQVLYYHFGSKEGLFRATLASVTINPFQITCSRIATPALLRLKKCVNLSQSFLCISGISRKAQHGSGMRICITANISRRA